MLRMVASATEEIETDSSVSTPLRQPPPPGLTTEAAALSQLECLRSKLQELEEENVALRSEVRVKHRIDEPVVEAGTENNRKCNEELVPLQK